MEDKSSHFHKTAFIAISLPKRVIKPRRACLTLIIQVFVFKTLTEENHPDPLEVAIELKNLEMVRIIIHFTNFEQDHPKSGSYLHLALPFATR